MVLGGALPLLFDWHFALIINAAGRIISRTAYLNVDFSDYVFIDTPVQARGRIDSIDGRKSTPQRRTDRDGRQHTRESNRFTDYTATTTTVTRTPPSPTFSTRRTLRRRVGSIACFARVRRSQTVQKWHLDLDSSARISPKNVGIHRFAHAN